MFAVTNQKEDRRFRKNSFRDEVMPGYLASKLSIHFWASLFE